MVAGMSAIVENFLQQDWKSRPRFSLQLAQEASQIPHLGDVAQKKREDKSLVLARISEPLVVGFPLFLGRLAGQVRLTRLVESEPVGEGVRFGFAVANTCAAYECIKCHSSLPCAVLVPIERPWRKHSRGRMPAPHGHFTPLGYTNILLASPVFSLSMALEKSFIGMRSVITGCRSSLPAFSSAVIWYQVWYMRRPLMPCTVMPLKIMSSEKFSETGFEVRPSREILPPRLTMSKAVRIESGWPAISSTTATPRPPVCSITNALAFSFDGSST